MMFIGFVFLTAVLNCIIATDIPLAIPPPFNQRRVGFPRAPVRIFKPGPMMHLGPRLPRRLPPPRNDIWLTKFDPRVGSWIKVKKRPNIINPKLRHHFAKMAHFSRKAKINKMMRLRKLIRMNIVRRRLYPRKDRGRRYEKYHKNPRGMIKIRPVIRSTGFIRQGIAGDPHSLLNNLHINRQRIIPRRIQFDESERFHHDNEYNDDFKVDDHEDFRGIQSSFDGRFSAGFRNNYQPNLDSVGAGVGGHQFDITRENIPQPENPTVSRKVAGLQQNDYYKAQNNIPKYEMDTLSLGDTQARVFNHANKMKNNINKAIHGSFDRKSDGSFVGMTGMTGASFNGMHGDDTSHFTSVGSVGDSGILGTQQDGFGMNSDDLTDTMTEKPLFNNRILNTHIASNPGSDIGFTTTGIDGFTADNRLPDGLLHDFHDVENLDGIDERDDHATDHHDDLTDRLNFDGASNLDDHIDFDSQSDDRLDLEGRLHNTFPQVPHVQNAVHNGFLNIPHIAQASDKFDRDDKGSEHDNRHIGHDDSPIDGLELLGSSRWSDIISELSNAASHNQMFDQVPRENVPVFPVNPHSSAGPSVSGGHIMMEHGNTDTGHGTLALLGIDPRNIASAESHPPHFPIPESFETLHEKNSVNSITTAKSVVTSKNDDSVTTVVTKQPVKISKGIESKPFTSGSHGSGPTLDISKAAEQLAMFGALDNLDYGNDSFDEDLRL